jgi:sec-independent protein translocase protein TatC
MTGNLERTELTNCIEDNEGCWIKFRPHLMELRYRIIAVIAYLTISVTAGFVFARRIYDWFLYPLPEGTTLHYFAPTEAFFTDLKIAMFAGIVVTVPFLLYQIWRFIAPGLTKSEKCVVKVVMPWLIVLFLCGACFTFFVVVPAGLSILLNWGGDRLTPVISVGRYFGFLFGLLIAGGVLFELPVLLAGLARLGLITRKVLITHFKSAVVVILILAAVLTPSPDAFTMMMLAIPIILLYLLSIVIVGVVTPIGGVRSDKDV